MLQTEDCKLKTVNLIHVISNECEKSFPSQIFEPKIYSPNSKLEVERSMLDFQISQALNH